MGYLSTVTLTLCEKDLKEMIVSAQKHDCAEEICFFIRSATLFKKEDICTLYWDSVKWYGSYPEISFIEDEIIKEKTCLFIRVGEEAGDIEVVNNDEDYVLGENIWVESYINTCNCGDENDINNYIT